MVEVSRLWLPWIKVFRHLLKLPRISELEQNLKHLFILRNLDSPRLLCSATVAGDGNGVMRESVEVLLSGN